MRKIIAREWLKLIIGIVFVPITIGLFAVVGAFISPDRYISTSLGDVYVAFFGPLFDKGHPDRLIVLAIILGPYFIYQFVRSLIWACKTSNEK